MNIREKVEELEEKKLSKFATLARNSKGRGYEEEKDSIRTCFQIDRDRIIHSKAFKRLKGKTQVFIMPKDDHFMNRLTHTLEASQIARTIAVSLNLNETLTEAIMLGHDLAHACYGHPGEEALDALFHKGYDHEKEVIRRVEVLEKRGSTQGLNLSFEVIDGISNHSGFTNKPKASTKEGMIAPFADKIAYLSSDMENAIEAGIIGGIPKSIRNVLGDTKGQMIDVMVKDIIYTSYEEPNIRMSDEVFQAVDEFRNYMFENVYFSDICRSQAKKAKRIIKELYYFLKENPWEIPADYKDKCVEQNIVDYISSMTDRYVTELYKKYFFI